MSARNVLVGHEARAAARRARSCRGAAGRTAPMASSVCTTIVWSEPLGPAEPAPAERARASTRAPISKQARHRTRRAAGERRDSPFTRRERRCRRSERTVDHPSCHPIPPRRPAATVAARGLRRLGLKISRITVDSHSGRALVPEAARRLGCPPHPHRRCVWRARPGPDIKETGLEAICSRCRHRCASRPQRRWHWLGRSARPATRAASTLQFEAKFETAVRLLRPVRHGLFGYRPCDTALLAASPFHGDHDLACGGPTTAPRRGVRRHRQQPRLLAAVLVLRAGRRPDEGPHDDRRRHARLQHRVVLAEAVVHGYHARSAGTSTRRRCRRASGRRCCSSATPTRPATRPGLSLTATSLIAAGPAGSTSATRRRSSARTEPNNGIFPGAARSPG